MWVLIVRYKVIQETRLHQESNKLVAKDDIAKPT